MSILSPSPDAATLAEIKIAQRLCRGVCRLFEDLGYAALTEFPLANGRRVDVIALDGALRLGRLERYVAFAWGSGATPIVVLNKADRCPDVPRAVSEASGAVLTV